MQKQDDTARIIVRHVANQGYCWELIVEDNIVVDGCAGFFATEDEAYADAAVLNPNVDV